MLKDFRLTDPARRALCGLQLGERGEARVPTLYWARSLVVTSHAGVEYRGETLCVGLYTQSQLEQSESATIMVDGVELLIGSRWHDRLEGKTLDFVNSRFVLLDQAPPGTA
jgi:hypothetical protein